MFNPKKLLDAKRKADEIKKLLETETVDVTEGNVRVRISGDERVLLVEIDGQAHDGLKKAFNKALKDVKMVQFKKLQGKMGDLGIPGLG